MKLHVLAIDLGKTVFHLVGLDQAGQVVIRKKCSRKQLLAFTANLIQSKGWLRQTADRDDDLRGLREPKTVASDCRHGERARVRKIMRNGEIICYSRAAIAEIPGNGIDHGSWGSGLRQSVHRNAHTVHLRLVQLQSGRGVGLRRTARCRHGIQTGEYRKKSTNFSSAHIKPVKSVYVACIAFADSDEYPAPIGL